MAHQSEPASTPIAKADNQLHHQVLTASHIASARNASEKRLGILHFASPIDYGWNGDIRKRYVLIASTHSPKTHRGFQVHFIPLVPRPQVT